MSTNFVPALFRQAAPYASFSRDDVPTNGVFKEAVYYHQMTSEWGLHGEGGFGGPINTSNGGDLPKGWYQFSVEAFDREGNGAAAHRFAVVPKGSSPGQPFNKAPGDLVIRDHGNDTGAIPSTLGGERHFKSPDIHVWEPGDPQDPIHVLNDEGFWQTQAISVTQGVNERLWVRVKNTGCSEILDPIWITVVEANAALINSEFSYVEPGVAARHIDYPGGALQPGQYGIVEFTWTPQSTGHLCLIAAVHAEDDPSSVPFANGAFDFGALESPQDKAHVPWDNNLAQRNVSIGGANFELGNPFDETIDLGVHFECNDFPIYSQPLGSAGATLVVDHHPALAAAWADVPGTILTDTGSKLFLEFHRCRVQLPAATLSALTALDAKIELWLPETVSGVFDVDLTGFVNGEPYGGMTYRIEGVGL
jgi:hypothetical protein